MKYCRSIYKALYKVDAELAQRTFTEYRSFCASHDLNLTLTPDHPIAAALIAKVSPAARTAAAQASRELYRHFRTLTCSCGGVPTLDPMHPELSLTSAQDLCLTRPTPSYILGVIGSTGTGKSQLAVDIAKHVRSSASPFDDAEIVSADSMQTYEGLDVITNKSDACDMDGVPHHLMSFLKPGYEYDITQFITDASKLVRLSPLRY